MSRTRKHGRNGRGTKQAAAQQGRDRETLADFALIDIHGVARRVGGSVSTVRRLIKLGRLPRAPPAQGTGAREPRASPSERDPAQGVGVFVYLR